MRERASSSGLATISPRIAKSTRLRRASRYIERRTLKTAEYAECAENCTPVSVGPVWMAITSSRAVAPPQAKQDAAGAGERRVKCARCDPPHPVNPFHPLCPESLGDTGLGQASRSRRREERIHRIFRMLRIAPRWREKARTPQQQKQWLLIPPRGPFPPHGAPQRIQRLQHIQRSPFDRPRCQPRDSTGATRAATRSCSVSASGSVVGASHTYCRHT